MSNREASPQELVSAMPQDVVASMGAFATIGDEVFIACRSDHDLAAIKDISPREYEVLVCRAQPMSVNAVGAALGLQRRSAQGYIGTAAKAMGAESTDDAITFIPVPETSLRDFSLYEINEDGKVAPKLSNAEMRVYEAVAEGLSIEQYAELHWLDKSTVRTHLHGIYCKLDIKAAGRCKNIELRRKAGALKNLSEYVLLLQSVAELQPAVQQLIAGAELLEQQGGIDLNADHVRTIRNPDLLERLAFGGFIPSSAVEDGKLTLSGLVAAMLSNKDGYEELLYDEDTQPAAREIIEQEVGHYLAKREAVKLDAAAQLETAA